MSKIAELFTHPTTSVQDWQTVVNSQRCAYLGKKCVKNRKSEPEIAIGTCAVTYGKEASNVVICPHRLLENSKIFWDSIHLLTLHEPGNELHIVPEVAIPGGSIDYFLVSARDERVKDFVAIEIQTMDTTGTVWPERQRFLHEQGLAGTVVADKPFGINWKMTAKTIYAAGIARCLGLQAEANVGLEVITRTLESKISAQTLLKI